MVAPLALLGLSVAADVVSTVTQNLSGKSKSAASASAGATGSAAGAKDPKLAKTADDFESMFLEHMMDRLTASEGTDGPLGENGTGGGVYRSMMATEHAKSIVKSGGVGIAASVYRDLLRMQEGAGHGS